MIYINESNNGVQSTIVEFEDCAQATKALTEIRKSKEDSFFYLTSTCTGQWAAIRAIRAMKGGLSS